MSVIKQEKIICPAVRLRKRNLQEDVLCLDYDDSFVENAVSSFERIFRTGKIVKTEGFITNMGRFVEAKEAMVIAIRNNQILELSNLHTKWIEWRLVGDERWKEVREYWRELKIKLESRELKPEDL